MLVQSKLNVPFTGGLSSYSAFILVLAAYDRCQYGEARLAACARRKSTGYVSPSQMFFPTGSDPEDSYAGSSNDGAGSVCAPIRTVSEGEVFLHFLSLYALSSSAFNPLTHGIGT